jgi:hypothetical protein
MNHRASRKALSQMVSNGGWSRQFEDPIPLPRGRSLVTLEDAASYIMKLSKAERDRPEPPAKPTSWLRKAARRRAIPSVGVE